MPGARPGLRILMVSAYYPPALNGYAIQCGDTATLLAARGHEVVVVTSASTMGDGDSGPVRCLRVLHNAPPEEFISIHPRYLVRQWRRHEAYRFNYRQCQAAATECRPDIAVIWQFDSIGIGVVHALQRLGIPVVFNVGDNSLATVISVLRDGALAARVLRRWLYDVKVAELDLSHLVLASRELRAFYAARGFPPASMTVIHNGIRSELVAATAPLQGPGTRLLYVGRLVPAKGLSLAIQALSRVNRDRSVPITLDVVGTGAAAYVNDLKALAKSGGIEACIRFLGYRNRLDVFDLYHAYDMLIFPSVVIEGFGLTVIEAMARGVPVIALDRGGPRDIITNMTDGILVGQDTPDFVADAIALLVDTPLLRKNMAAAAIRTVSERFTLERHVDLTESLMSALVERRGMSQVEAGAK